MQIIQTWQYMTDELSNVSIRDLRIQPTTNSYRYVNNPSFEALKHALIRPFDFDPPKVIVDAPNGIFLKLKDITNITVGESLYFLNSRQLLPGTKMSNNEISFVNFYGDIENFKGPIFHLYQLTKPDISLVNPLVLLEDSNLIVKVHYLIEPKIGSQVKYNGQIHLVQKKIGVKYQINSLKGEKLLKLPIEFQIYKKQPVENFDIYGNSIYLGSNVIAMEKNTNNVQVGNLIYFTTTDTFIIENSDGVFNVRAPLLLPSDDEIKVLNKKTIKDLFSTAFEDYQLIHPEAIFKKYKNKKKIIPFQKQEQYFDEKAKRRRLAGSYESFSFFWKNLAGLESNYEKEGFSRYKQKTNPPQLVYQNLDGDLLVSLDLGRRPDPEILLVLFHDLWFKVLGNEEGTTINIEGKYLNFFNVFRDGAYVENDIYQPSNLLIYPVVFNYCSKILERCGLNLKDAPSKIVPKILLPKRESVWIPVNSLKDKKQIERFLMFANEANQILGSIKGKENIRLFTYFSELKTALENQLNVVSKDEFNTLQIQGLETGLFISVEFYTNYLKTWRKGKTLKDLKTAQQIAHSVDEFMNQMNEFNIVHNSQWMWKQFLTDEFILKTPSTSHRQSQLDAISFNSKTETERYNFFWKVFRSKLFDKKIEEYPVFKSRNDKALELLQSVVKESVGVQNAPVEVEKNENKTGLFGVITVGLLFLGAAYYLKG